MSHSKFIFLFCFLLLFSKPGTGSESSLILVSHLMQIEELIEKNDIENIQSKLSLLSLEELRSNYEKSIDQNNHLVSLLIRNQITGNSFKDTRSFVLAKDKTFKRWSMAEIRLFKESVFTSIETGDFVKFKSLMIADHFKQIFTRSTGRKDEIYRHAVKFGRSEILDYLFLKNYKPSTSAFRSSFSLAADENNVEMLNWIYDNISFEASPPSVRNWRAMLLAAAQKGHVEVFMWFLDEKKGDTFLSDWSITLYLQHSFVQDNIVFRAYMIERVIGRGRFINNIVKFLDDALSRYHRCLPLAEFILNYEDENGQKIINQTRVLRFYSRGLREYDNELINILTPFLSQENIEQQRRIAFRQNLLNRGVAYEIHDYAQRLIPSSHEPDSPKSQLNAVVFEGIRKRLADDNIEVEFCDPLSIADYYTKDLEPAEKNQKISEIINVMTHGITADSNLKLSLVSTFIKTYHSECFDTWVKGFVNESQVAYESRNSLSCSKGIDERMLTGLRGIDQGLDLIFSKSEGPALIKVFLAQVFRLDEEKNLNFLVPILYDLGLRSTSSDEEMKSIFKSFLCSRIESYGGDVLRDYQIEIEGGINFLCEDCFEALIQEKLIQLESASSSSSSSSLGKRPRDLED